MRVFQYETMLSLGERMGMVDALIFILVRE